MPTKFWVISAGQCRNNGYSSKTKENCVPLWHTVLPLVWPVKARYVQPKGRQGLARSKVLNSPVVMAALQSEQLPRVIRQTRITQVAFLAFLAFFSGSSGFYGRQVLGNLAPVRTLRFHSTKPAPALAWRVGWCLVSPPLRNCPRTLEGLLIGLKKFLSSSKGSCHEQTGSRSGKNSESEHLGGV